MTPAGLLRLKSDENCFLRVYDDATGGWIESGARVEGNPTIGFGRNLAANGISADEAALMLTNDIDHIDIALADYEWYSDLDPVRQDVLVNAAYNLGVNGLLSFHRMIAALEDADWDKAAAELLDSSAARKLPNRYGRLAVAMRTGKWD